VRIYLSAPLFTQAERRWNRLLAAGIQERIAGAEVILPQDFKFGSSYNDPADFPRIFQACVEGVRQADVMVAVLDGPDADSGVALEMGIACERGIPIIGVRTDYREGQDRGANLAVAGACAQILREMSFGEDLDQLVKDLAGKIVAALKNPQGRPDAEAPGAPSHAYARRVSAEEAREGYVLVLKDRLSFFPPLGRPFAVSHGGTVRRAKVEARPCTCRGPERPHEHYFIRWPGLEKGCRVAIRLACGPGAEYKLDVQSPPSRREPRR
jgi:nucleoside 2-deoxyribosyltransferase